MSSCSCPFLWTRHSCLCYNYTHTYIHFSPFFPPPCYSATACMRATLAALCLATTCMDLVMLPPHAPWWDDAPACCQGHVQRLRSLAARHCMRERSALPTRSRAAVSNSIRHCPPILSGCWWHCAHSSECCDAWCPEQAKADLPGAAHAYAL
jgi:hypothetical protein